MKDRSQVQLLVADDMVVGAGDVSYDQARNVVVTAVEPQEIAPTK
jgi:hypothetical protein